MEIGLIREGQTISHIISSSSNAFSAAFSTSSKTSAQHKTVTSIFSLSGVIIIVGYISLLVFALKPIGALVFRVFVYRTLFYGNIKNGLRHGRGTLTTTEKVGRLQLTFDWKDDKPNLQGTCVFPDGKKYIGEFNEKIQFHNFTFIVEAADKRKIKQVKVTINNDKDDNQKK